LNVSFRRCEGDVPGLARSSKNHSIPASDRAAFALILVFVFWIFGGNKIAFAVVNAEEGHLEFSTVGVSISDLPNGTQFVIPDALSEYRQGASYLLRLYFQDEAITTFENGWGDISETGPYAGGQPVIAPSTASEIASNRNYSCLRGSYVSYGDPYKLGFYRVIEWALNEPNHNSWSMGGAEFLTGQLQGFKRQASLLASSSPQSSGEGCNNNRGDSSNADPVPFHETSRAPHINSDDGTETGIAFFGALFAFIAAFLTYAGLKKWR
jgi:hypothetical protein